jgi:NadR type nicotinamide-nucleotide adenylyltransferase
MRKVAIVGAESSGKTTLAGALGRACNGVVAAEFARTYLEAHGPSYTEADLLTIAVAQARAEDAAMDLAARNGQGLVVCDTDLITIRIWSEEKFGRCDPWTREASEHRHYDLWLLCRPDIPWEADPLRENPHDRERLFSVYGTMLKALGKPFVVLGGPREDRLRHALDAIDGLEEG